MVECLGSAGLEGVKRSPLQQAFTELCPLGDIQWGPAVCGPWAGFWAGRAHPRVGSRSGGGG